MLVSVWERMIACILPHVVCYHLVAKSCLPLLWPHGLWPAGLLCPWDIPGKNPGAGCHFLLQGIFPTQESNLRLLRGRQILYHWATWKAPHCIIFQKSLEIQWRNILTGCRSKSKNTDHKVEIPIINNSAKTVLLPEILSSLEPCLALVNHSSSSHGWRGGGREGCV